MDTFRYLVRFLYRIRWYLATLPLIALIVAFLSTRNMEHNYDTNTTIYTGMITSYNIEGGSGAAGGNPHALRFQHTPHLHRLLHLHHGFSNYRLRL